MGKTVAVLIKDAERQYEGLRSSLGLLLEDHVVSMYVMDHEVDMTEMEGTRYSNVKANVDKHGFQPVTAETIGPKLREYDLVIPF